MNILQNIPFYVNNLVSINFNNVISGVFLSWDYVNSMQRFLSVLNLKLIR